MPLFVRAAGAVLLLSVAAAKAVAPAAELNSTAARLEALVRDMAEGQQGAVAAAPTPQRLAEEDAGRHPREALSQTVQATLGIHKVGGSDGQPLDPGTVLLVTDGLLAWAAAPEVCGPEARGSLEGRIAFDSLHCARAQCRIVVQC